MAIDVVQSVSVPGRGQDWYSVVAGMDTMWPVLRCGERVVGESLQPMSRS